MFAQKLNTHKVFKRWAKALIRLRICTGWSEPYHIVENLMHWLKILEVIFSFHSERALHIKKKSSMHTSNLSDLMYARIIKHCLVYFCVAFLRVLRIMTQNESCDIHQLYVVELALHSEQKLYYLIFCWTVMIPIKTIVIGPIFHRTSLTIKYNRVISPGISHVVCES